VFLNDWFRLVSGGGAVCVSEKKKVGALRLAGATGCEAPVALRTCSEAIACGGEREGDVKGSGSVGWERGKMHGPTGFFSGGPWERRARGEWFAAGMWGGAWGTNGMAQQDFYVSPGNWLV